jgi:LPXTG-motif cell wall-anchored protein
MLPNNWLKYALGICAIFLVVLLIGVGSVSAQTTKTLKGTVVEVDGKNLVVKMSSGEVQVFTPPPDRKFIIDGKELTLAELQPGTQLTATVTESPTTTMQKTTQTVEGDVLYASGTTVVLRLTSGEAKKYVIKKDDPITFVDHNGKEITVFDLRKRMHITARKITEAPLTEIASNTEVTGTAAKGAAAMPEPTPTPAPAAEPAPAPAKTLPKTGSSLPLVSILGILFIGIAFGVRAYLR